MRSAAPTGPRLSSAKVISSTSNQRVKDVVRLRKRRDRDETGLFVVEGRRELRRAIDAGCRVDQIFVCPSLASPDEWHGAGIDVAQVSDSVFDRLSGREGPDGVLGVAHAFDTTLGSLRVGDPALVLVITEIEKPGNLGAMIRTAAATGASVIVADPVTDLFNPNVVRASQGALFSVPIAATSSGEAIAWLTANGVQILATTPSAAVPYWTVPTVAPTAIVIGAEDTGLGDDWLSAADHRVLIPMASFDGTDSLNAASAAAIVLFDAVRQRAVYER